MKIFYTFIIAIFLVNSTAAQKIFIGSDVSINSIAGLSSSSSSNGLDFKSGIVVPSANIEILWDSKKRILKQQGLKLQLSNSYFSLNDQRYTVGKIGLYYSSNFGFDYSEEGEHKIGITSYIGPHINVTDRIIIDKPDSKLVPAIGFSAGAGISFKMFNHIRARIMYNFSYDVLELSDLTNAGHINRFISNGISIGISTPITKINGKSFRERNRSLKIK